MGREKIKKIQQMIGLVWLKEKKESERGRVR